jgi:hypothetical protein
MIASADPLSSNSEDHAKPGAAPDTSGIQQLAQRANENADVVSQTQRDVTKISSAGGIITHRDFYMAEPFFTLTKRLFVILIGSTVILAAVMFITQARLAGPDIELADRILALIGWIVIPLVTFIIGYGFGSAITRPRKDGLDGD